MMVITRNTRPTDLLPYLGAEASIINAFRCRENLIEAGWDGFNTLDIPREVFVEAAFRSPERKAVE